MYLHLCVGINLHNALPHRVRLVLAHGSARRNDLPVQVGQAHPIVVDQVKRAHAADSKDGHPRRGQLLHALGAEK